MTLTVCPYCGTGCQINVEYRNGHFTVHGYNKSIVNQGKLCIKGYQGLSYSSSSQRLNYPMIRKNGILTKVTWNEALDYVSEKLKTIRNKYGADAVAFQSSAKCTNEENYLMQKIARMFGTNNIDHCARSCHSSTVAGLIKTIGTAAATGSIKSLKSTKTYFIIGSNTTEQHPIIGTTVLKGKKSGSYLIVADPRKTKLASNADIFLQFRPGTDVALLNSIMFVILKENLYDEEFIKNRTEDFDKLAAEIEKYPPELTEAITGVDAELVRRAAEIYAKYKPSAILYGMGITQHIHGTENVMSVSNLALMTGNIGKYGAGIFPLRGQNNVQGSSDMGALAEFYPGYIPVDSEGVKRFEDLWKTELPKKVGLTLSEMFDAAAAGKVKAIYLMGENPVITEANVAEVEKGIENLELFIVQDIFLTETASLADVVLPAATALEKDGTFTNTERRVQRIVSVKSPPGEAKQDWWILSEIAHRLVGTERYRSVEDVFNEITQAIPNYSGIRYQDIYPTGKQWPVNEQNPDGTEILHTVKFTRGLGRFYPVSYEPPSEIADAEYPFILTTGRNYYHWHSGTMTRRSDILERESPSPYVEISMMDAKQLNIRDGQAIDVESRHGRITLPAKVTDKIPTGIIFVPFHFKEARVNLLVGDNLDPYSKIPEFKVVAARVIV
ncbi:formate ferredoxin oxidoreductase [FMOR] alpha subunit [Thermoplasma volcanium GSS1]|uniref:Formate ferredoxin oxidoreductase [FMOR] alpha subunit n=1 Tax=Thermoplasma volcanium (strain ATCC 51530 / DSM 4299 / JCM 9571 / NBRC 15438 / GSS1) TaxID=273116 RepID=Q97CU9_THEVO|nr:formate dehydrogenase subunit alpha [Thermoplasma volcanium]BAB59144.1 formate ferredoxin oxidoreductase [FMOR] alpha subunit [Thermoplasma volcanium GSS1]